jgi:hypothetical protein
VNNCRTELYPKGIKVSDDKMATLNIKGGFVPLGADPMPDWVRPRRLVSLSRLILTRPSPNGPG